LSVYTKTSQLYQQKTNAYSDIEDTKKMLAMTCKTQRKKNIRPKNKKIACNDTMTNKTLEKNE